MKFSIITVVRNDEPGLARTAASIESQTLRDFEWLVVDGASSDGTVEWLRTRSDLNYLLWVSEPDRGHYDAMNKGVDRARGEYVVFMNAGDELADPEVLEVVASCTGNEPDLVYGDAIDIAADGTSWYRRARSHTAIWWTMFACHQAMYYRREAIGDRRYSLTYPLSADYAFTSELLRSRSDGAQVARVGAPLCRFWLGGVSWVYRRRSISEDFRIRSTILDMPLPINAALFAAHHVHTWMKRRMPRLARAIRSGSSTTRRS